MPGYPRAANIVAIAALTVILGFASATEAGAQVARHAVHHKVHAAVSRLAPLAPGVELHTSTSVSPGAENHYYSDTVASSHSDLMDMSHRYGQSTAPQYNSAEPLFQF